MLQAGINFLGLRDSFVPVHRYEFLLERTQAHINLARDAVQKFVIYQSKADDLEAAERETEFELGVARQPIPFGVPSDVTSQFAEFTLGAFEGYGPAGPWQLELRNVNVRNISDITLTFDLEAATDASDLENKVEPLIRP